LGARQRPRRRDIRDLEELLEVSRQFVKVRWHWRVLHGADDELEADDNKLPRDLEELLQGFGGTAEAKEKRHQGPWSVAVYTDDKCSMVPMMNSRQMTMVSYMAVMRD
jgi:hypothetical protein